MERHTQRRLGVALTTVALLNASLGPQPWAAPYTQAPPQPSGRAPETPSYRPSGPPAGLALPPVPPTPPAQAAEGQRFNIIRVEIQGKAILPIGEIRSETGSLEGRRATLGEIEAVRQKLTKRIIDRGYLNSGVVIPEDGFKNGVLTMVIAEGRLSEFRLSGQERLRVGYIRNRLLHDPEETLHLPTVQERFQMLLADPLIAKLNGRILPGSRSGQAILDVTVTRARPYQLSAFGDNYRPPSIGAEVFGLSGWVRNLSGLGDLLDFTYTTGAGSDRYSGGWRVPLTDRGTEAYFRFDEGASSVVEEPVRDLNIRSDVHVLEGGITHPILTTLRQRLALGISFGVRRNETTISGLPYPAYAGDDSGRSRLTVLRLSQDYLRRWEDDMVSLRSTFSFGLDALGASRQRVSFGPGGEFFAWLGQAQYAHRFTDDGLQLVLRGALQQTDSHLLPLEQIAVGGVGTVRGYRENHFVRDQGFTLTAELQVPVWRGEQTGQSLVLVPFVDHGEAWNLRDRPAAITSLGIGFQADYQLVHAELYYGYGFDRTPASATRDLQDHGIHFMGRIDAF